MAAFADAEAICAGVEGTSAMRRPERRLHLLLWTLIAPAVAAGLAFALRHAPADPVADLPGVVAADGAR